MTSFEQVSNLAASLFPNGDGEIIDGERKAVYLN